jgi:Co/Zn/Cd efflux system component
MTLRQAVLVVALLNGAYFVVEFIVARQVASVSLFADSIDFLEDTSLSLLVFFAATWTLQRRARVGHVLALLLLVPAATSLWILVDKLLHPTPPEAVGFGLASVGALAVNLVCAYILVSHRNTRGSLSRAAWLSARNDAMVNVAMIGAALLTLVWVSAWPDVVLGAAVIALNADAAVKVWKRASAERLGSDEAES